jgi:hypothetical protein
VASLSECVATTRLIRGWSYPERRAATAPPLEKTRRPTFLSRKRQGGARKAAVAAGVREAGHSSLLVREPLAQTLATENSSRLGRFWRGELRHRSICLDSVLLGFRDMTPSTPERDSGCPVAARGNNRPHRVHFQGRWFPARMGFWRDANLHVMAE